MSYYRVMWIDEGGKHHVSEPLHSWIDAEMFRRELNNPTAHIERF
jgi:hypothetical protein